jgi:hypothetical protein
MARKPTRSPSPRSRGDGRGEGRYQSLAPRRRALSRIPRPQRGDNDLSPHAAKGKSFRLRSD